MSITSITTPLNPDTERTVRRFIIEEARLADERDYQGWLNLWAPGEVLYWVAPRADTDPRREVSFVYDDRGRLEQRVSRWESGFAWSQDPPSNTNRIAGNIEILSADGPRLTAAANVHVLVSRKGSASLLAERVTYLLAETPDGYRLREKKVVFADPEAPVGNVTFVL